MVDVQPTRLQPPNVRCAPFNLDFSPFAANHLRLCFAPCYHWPMSHRKPISPKAMPGRPALKPQTQFPKRNGCHLSDLWPARHSSLACPDGGRATRHCLSNRNTPKLKFAVTHTKQSLGQFLIDTFRALTATPAQYRPDPNNLPAAQKLENRLTFFHSATSKFLIDNFHRDVSRSASGHSPLDTSHCRSNRHTYEKLEIDVSHRKQTSEVISNRHKTALCPR